MAGQDDRIVEFMAIEKTYDGVTRVVRDLDLSIARGEFLTLLGPSGSGKTTTLMMLAGFEDPTAGEIMLDGRPLTRVPPHKRNIGMVFQNYALFPHRTVAENVAYPLIRRRTPKAEMREKVAQALKMVELTGYGKRRPAQLSGGQQQRVALARALVFQPKLVLMDEPLGALDRKLREQMQLEIKHLHDALGMTFVYVTHDQNEALTMSDRVAVFHDGVVQQVAAPRTLYEAPANAFVAGFVGDNNALPGEVVEIDHAGGHCRVRLADGATILARIGDVEAAGDAALVSIRPERLRIAEPGAASAFDATLTELIYMGDHIRARAQLASGGEIQARVGLDEAAGLEPGRTVALDAPVQHAIALKPFVSHG